LPPRDSISVSDVNGGQLIQIKLEAHRQGHGGEPGGDETGALSVTAAIG
jgi:hypothetical protein